jgi:hypothetical protein
MSHVVLYDPVAHPGKKNPRQSNCTPAWIERLADPYSSLVFLLLELALYCCPCNPCREQASGRADKTGRKTVVIVQDAPEPFRKLPATRASAAPLSERQYQKYEQREAEKEQEELSGGFLKLREPFHRPQSSSASRLTAGASGFFILSQSGERPER